MFFHRNGKGTTTQPDSHNFVPQFYVSNGGKAKLQKMQNPKYLQCERGGQFWDSSCSLWR